MSFGGTMAIAWPSLVIVLDYKTVWSQPKGAEEPETNPGVPLQKEQAGTMEGEVVAD